MKHEYWFISCDRLDAKMNETIILKIWNFSYHSIECRCFNINTVMVCINTGYQYQHQHSY